MEKKNRNTLLAGIGISLGTGLISALLTMGGMREYADLYHPPLSPPGWVFPVVWTILYVLMGIASYRIYQSQGESREPALALYLIQLFFNFGWSILFFNLNAYFAAFAWLLALWLFVYLTVRQFLQIDRTAGLLMLPYLVWITFAGYLNLAVAIADKIR